MLKIIGSGESFRVAMRQLKFRIWNGKRFIKNLQSNLITFDGDVINPITLEMWKDKTRIVQQFTGLQDSTGKDIYEGDILQFHKGEPYQSEYEVYWRKCGFSLISAKRDGDKYGVFTKSLENLCPADKPIIIGNRFENPELL